MIPPAFEYLRPKTVPEAIAFLQQYGDDAKILSGGQSLIPMMKFRLARPSHLIDINRISGLSYIKEEDGYLKIGGLVREAELEDSPLIRPKVSDPFRYIPCDRRSTDTEQGDIGGQSRARRSGERSPSHDDGAWERRLLRLGRTGERVIPVESFFITLFTTDLQHGEIVTEIRIPTPPARSGGAYLKLERKVGDFAAAAVAAQLTVDQEGTCQKAGIAAHECRCNPDQGRSRERSFSQRWSWMKPTFSQAAQLAAEAAQPSSDLRGPEEYRARPGEGTDTPGSGSGI